MWRVFNGIRILIRDSDEKEVLRRFTEGNLEGGIGCFCNKRVSIFVGTHRFYILRVEVRVRPTFFTTLLINE